MNFYEKVYELCSRIPKGRVSTYGELARKLNTKAYRLVGHALKNNPYVPDVPCHRVVNSKGNLHGFKGSCSNKELDEKARLLEKEGVRIKNNKVVDFEKVLYRFE